MTTITAQVKKIGHDWFEWRVVQYSYNEIGDRETIVLASSRFPTTYKEAVKAAKSAKNEFIPMEEWVDL